MTFEDLLPLIRDEIGDGTPPTDTDLEDSYAVQGSWRLVAVRVLSRRLAEAVAAAGGGVSSVSIPGAISVSLRGGDITALQRQIDRLRAEHAAEVAGLEVTDGRSGWIHRARWR